MEIRTYTKENIRNLYLSFYADVIREKDRIIFYSRIWGKHVVLEIPDEKQVPFLRKIDQGCEVEELRGILQTFWGEEQPSAVEKEAEKAVQQMMRMGVLE